LVYVPASVAAVTGPTTQTVEAPTARGLVKEQLAVLTSESVTLIEVSGTFPVFVTVNW